jgi:hypothetical protein
MDLWGSVNKFLESEISAKIHCCAAEHGWWDLGLFRSHSHRLCQEEQAET